MKAAQGAALLQDPLFPRLKAFLIDATGMVFYADKDGDLARVVASRLGALGLGDCTAYLALLGEEPQGKAELEAAIAEMTIGETYFFRHREQFDILRNTIFPEIIQRNRQIRRLRVWSAGCATGPEPYSIAILLRRHFSDCLAGWNVSVLGTDINQKFLGRAREGLYDEWAFRAVPDSFKAECFTREGKKWLIREEYRNMVTFQNHNLITGSFPSVLHGIAAFDLIICRNVIIYFSRETVRELVPRFHDSLVDHGWLIMGHAESNVELFRDFRTVNAPGAVVYQKMPRDGLERPASKRGPMCQALPSSSFSPPSIPPRLRPLHPVTVLPGTVLPGAVLPGAFGPDDGGAPPFLTSLPVPPLLPQPLTVPALAAGGAPNAPPAVALAASPVPQPVVSQPVPQPGRMADLKSELKSLGNRGEWERAEALCCQMLEEAPLDAMLHYYHGLMLEQMGRLDDCDRSLRRAIYLDRTFILPHYHQGLLGLRQGDRAKARRSLRNALALLSRVEEGSMLDEAEGLTAARLKEMVATHLDILGA